MAGGNLSLCTHSQNASNIFFFNCLYFLRLAHSVCCLLSFVILKSLVFYEVDIDRVRTVPILP